jgi:MFS family permease
MEPTAPVAAGRVRALVSSLTATIACNLSVFLTGSLAVQMQADLGFGDARLGLAVGAFYAVGALVSSRAGRVVERLGAQRSLRLATLIAALGQIGIATVVQSSTGLILLMMVGGIANSWSQPASNVFLARVVPRHRLGLAFGVQKSAIPAAALLGGLAVPSFQAVGWRWAFVVAAVFALVAAWQVPPEGESVAATSKRASGARPDVAVAALTVLAIGVGLGSAASNALSAFLVRGGVEADLSENAAAGLLVVGSILGIAVRLLFGIGADRRPRHTLPFISALFAMASVSFALLAFETAWLFVIATPIAFATAYAWPGLFHLAVVRSNPSAPGAATGIAMTGTLGGAVLGPLVFGALAEATSFTVAWSFGAGLLVLASVIVALAGRRIHDAPVTAPALA